MSDEVLSNEKINEYLEPMFNGIVSEYSDVIDTKSCLEILNTKLENIENVIDAVYETILEIINIIQVKTEFKVIAEKLLEEALKTIINNIKNLQNNKKDNLVNIIDIYIGVYIRIILGFYLNEVYKSSFLLNYRINSSLPYLKTGLDYLNNLLDSINEGIVEFSPLKEILKEAMVILHTYFLNIENDQLKKEIYDTYLKLTNKFPIYISNNRDKLFTKLLELLNNYKKQEDKELEEILENILYGNVYKFLNKLIDKVSENPENVLEKIIDNFGDCVREYLKEEYYVRDRFFNMWQIDDYLSAIVCIICSRFLEKEDKQNIKTVINLLKKLFNVDGLERIMPKHETKRDLEILLSKLDKIEGNKELEEIKSKIKQLICLDKCLQKEEVIL